MTILIRLDLQLLLRLNYHKYYNIFIKHESILAKLILSQRKARFSLLCVRQFHEAFLISFKK